MRLTAVLGVVLAIILPTRAPKAGAAQAPSTPAAPDAVFKQYCVTCHNQRLKTGDLALDAPELTNVAAHADVWEKVIRKVRAGMMPPARRHCGTNTTFAPNRVALFSADSTGSTAGTNRCGPSKRKVR